MVKKKMTIIAFISGLLLISVNMFAADGDLIVNGNVGIGTTSPATKLDVQGNMILRNTGNNSAYFFINRPATSVASAIHFQTVGTDDWVMGPGYSGTNSDFRIWNSGTNTDALSISKSNGNVGLGTTNPGARLEVDGDVKFGTIGTASTLNIYSSNNNGTGSFGKIYMDNTNLGRMIIANGYGSASTENSLSIASTVFPYWDNTYGLGITSLRWANISVGTGNSSFAGNVGIGTTSPGRKLQVIGGTNLQDYLVVGADVSPAQILHVEGNAYIKNNVGIGTTIPIYPLHVSGNAYATGSFVNGSDIRFKENIISIESPLAKIMNIEGVSYNWKTVEYKDKGFPEGRHYGVIAQQIEQLIPEVVKTNNLGEKAVAYTELVPVLIEAIKEQQTIITKLENKIEELSKKFENNIRQ